MSLIIGLTGGIGCGKTCATNFFADLGVDIIDTDKISQELTQSGGAAIDLIKKTFGDNLVTINGALDRTKMRELVFSDRTAKQKLEAILHPLIYDEVSRRIKQSKSPYTIVAIPLFFETTDYREIIQRVLVIDCDEEKQVVRTMARSKLNEHAVRAIMATQVSRQQRLQEADDIIINNDDMDSLHQKIARLHQKYLKIS